MHYVEDCLPNDIKDKFTPPESARRLYPESEWLIESWAPPAKPWYTIQKRAYENGYINDTMIGNAKCILMQVKSTIELYRKALENEPFALYGLA